MIRNNLNRIYGRFNEQGGPLCRLAARSHSHCFGRFWLTFGGMTFKSFRCSFVLLIFIILGSAYGCRDEQRRNFNAIPSFTANFVNAVIEIPAGTCREISYNEQQRMFLPEKDDGFDKVVDFLPFPGNYGFVPSTYIDPVMGGDGDPVKILVISESLPTGTVIEVIPLFVMYFDDGTDFPGKLPDSKIIAVPADERKQIIDALSYIDLVENYPDLVDILIKWFSSYRGHNSNELEAIGDADAAVDEIEKWEIRRF